MIASIVLFIGIQAVDAQIVFNKRLHFGYSAATLTSILPFDSCYFATGVIADSIFPYRAGALFVKFDQEGDVEYSKALTSTARSFELWENTLFPTEDGGFVVSGYTVDSLMRALFIRFDPEGDTLFTRQYFHPNYPEESFFRPMDMQPTPDGGYVLVNWLTTLTVGDDNLSVLKLDSLGMIEWHKVYGNNLRERPQSILVGPEGDLIVGSIRGNNNLVAENYTFQTWILGLDPNGVFEWNFLSPIDSLRDAANDMILMDNGGLLVASGFGTEIENPSVNDVVYEKAIMRLSATHSIVWEKQYVGPYPTSLTRTTNVIASGNAHFIAAGTSVHVFPQEDSSSIKGWLYKGDIDGDSIWKREYIILENQQNEHTIYDIKETGDGGLILVGQVFDRTFEDAIPQQAWILKLDEHGCLVPGCHLLNAVEEVADHSPLLRLYPNPAGDYLHVYFRHPQAPSGGHFRLINVQGLELRSWPATASDTTYILYLDDCAPGLYFLQYWERGRLVRVEKVVVE